MCCESCEGACAHTSMEHWQEHPTPSHAPPRTPLRPAKQQTPQFPQREQGPPGTSRNGCPGSPVPTLGPLTLEGGCRDSLGPALGCPRRPLARRQVSPQKAVQGSGAVGGPGGACIVLPSDARAPEEEAGSQAEAGEAGGPLGCSLSSKRPSLRGAGKTGAVRGGSTLPPACDWVTTAEASLPLRRPQRRLVPWGLRAGRVPTSAGGRQARAQGRAGRTPRRPGITGSSVVTGTSWHFSCKLVPFQGSGAGRPATLAQDSEVTETFVSSRNPAWAVAASGTRPHDHEHPCDGHRSGGEAGALLPPSRPAQPRQVQSRVPVPSEHLGPPGPPPRAHPAQALGAPLGMPAPGQPALGRGSGASWEAGLHPEPSGPRGPQSSRQGLASAAQHEQPLLTIRDAVGPARSCSQWGPPVLCREGQTDRGAPEPSPLPAPIAVRRGRRRALTG